MLGGPVSIGQVLEMIEYVLAMKRKYEGASIACARATKEYSIEEMRYDNAQELERCEYNLQQLNQIRSDREKVLLEAPLLC